MPVGETVVRGTVVYLSLFAMLRVLATRETGTVGIADMLVIVLIADAAQNAMAGDYKSIPDGLLLIVVILGWSFALDWLAFRFPALRPIIRPRPRPLVRDGELLAANLRRELISEEELYGQLRAQGVADVGEVRMAYMESDGTISMIPRGKRTARGSRARRRRTT